MDTEVKCTSTVKRHMHDGSEDDNYQRLKQNLCGAITSEQLEQLKQHFAVAINSRRSLSRVQFPCDLFCLLEIRDCISKDDIACLTNLTAVINNGKVQELVHTYKKLYGSDQKPCSNCTEHSRVAIVQPVSPNTEAEPCAQPNTVAERPEYIVNYNNDAQAFLTNRSMPVCEASSEWDAIIERLSQNIGENWRVLLRELGLIEKIITDVRLAFEDVEVQAAHALRIWKRESGGNATLAALEAALNSRMCKQKGLGPHLIHQSRILCT